MPWSRPPPYACACVIAAVAVGHQPPRGVGGSAVMHYVQTANASASTTNSSKPLLSRPPTSLRVLNATAARTRHQPAIFSAPPSEEATAEAGAQVARTGRTARLTTEVEIDQIIIAALGLLALYCLVALRRAGRRDGQLGGGGADSSTMSAMGSMGAGGAGGATRKARGATRAQIETHLAHTTVTLYEGVGSDFESSSSTCGTPALRSDSQFDQQCAICLELLRRPLNAGERNTVRILRCAHAFHEGESLPHHIVLYLLRLTNSPMIECIDAWLLRNTQCPLCLKQPW